MFSVVKVALKGPASLNGEKVSKFSLSAPEGTVLTGRAAINLSSATIDTWNISNNTVTATYTTDAPGFGGEYPDLDNVVWFVVNPGTIEPGAKVVFAGETANYTFTKEVTLSKALTFPESQLAVINLTLAEENCTKKAAGNAYVLHEDELIEGDYLVVYEGKAMKASVTKTDSIILTSKLRIRQSRILIHQSFGIFLKAGTIGLSSTEINMQQAQAPRIKHNFLIMDLTTNLYGWSRKLQMLLHLSL